MTDVTPALGDSWVTDTELSPRFPYYTRANADEVGPDPFSPLGWSLGWAKGCVPGVATGFVEFGVVTRDELVLDPPEVFGNWGGYFYNQLSLPRVMGVRMPGATPEAIDQAYFGDHPGVPAYIADPRDDNEAQSAKLAETMGWAMSTAGYPLQERAAELAREAAEARPDLGSTPDAALVARGRAMAALVDEIWVPYCQVCLAASLGPGAVQAVCAGIGRSSDAVKLLSAIGGVDSADASFAMWDLSRIVRNSAELCAAFDGDLDALLVTLRSSGSVDAASFLTAWDRLMRDFGHRGPNEWDMRAHSWSTRPRYALSMLERLRHQDDARSPYAAKAAAAAERERLAAELSDLLAADPVAQGTLAAGIASAGVFLALRERGKNACIRVLHEGKLAFLELGRRMQATGVVRDPQDVFMLLDSELDAFLADPRSFGPTIRQRAEQFEELHDLVPPYIVSAHEGVPPISTWAHKSSTGASRAAEGDVLTGAAGAPGVVTGRARVVLDPSDPSALEPGDIMIAPTTDPSWTPLFLAAAAVVVNVGAVASHAAIVCRELGVPCAVSVHDATSRIPDGATVTIDGSTGAVTVLAVP
jgi:pyruvate,water dikinase